MISLLIDEQKSYNSNSGDQLFLVIYQVNVQIQTVPWPSLFYTIKTKKFSAK